MVMKSIFIVSCFVVMALAIGTEEWKMPPMKIIHLKADMNATCNSLKSHGCRRVNEVVFTVNCEKEAYQETFCQVNHALRNCKDYNVSSFLSDFHDNKCTPKRSLITLKDFCQTMLGFLDRFYGKCATIKKGARLNIA